MEKLYRTSAIVPLPDTNGRIFLKNLFLQKEDSLRYPLWLVQLVMSCGRFASLDHHVESYLKPLKTKKKLRLLRHALTFVLNYPGNEEIKVGRKILKSVLIESLNLMYKAGYLIEKNELIAQVKSAPKQTEKITSICIPTKGRSQSLLACIESYHQNISQYGRQIQFNVFDDEASEEVAQGLRNFSHGHTAKISYAGLKEKRRFADLMIKSGLSPESVNFCLFGAPGATNTCGANRNATLLHTTDELMLSSDDDVFCKIALNFGFGEGFIYGRRESGFENLLSYSSREEVLKNSPETLLDFLNQHEQVLGQPTIKALDQVSPQARSFELLGLNSTDLNGFLSGDHRVLVSLNGIRGDSGMASSDVVWLMPIQKQQLLMQSQEKFVQVFKSREIAKSVDNLTMGRPFSMMSTVFGLDNRAALPPFYPIGRAADRLFGFMVNNCDKNSYFCYLPWTLLHAPPDERQYRHDTAQEGALMRPINHVRTARVIEYWLSNQVFGQSVFDPALRLQIMATSLKGLAQLSERDFIEFLRKSIFDDGQNRLQRLQALQEEFKGAPIFWIKGMQAQMRELHRHLSEEIRLINDVAGENNEDLSSSVKITKRNIFLYGNLLEQWQEIRTVARKLRESGNGLARPLEFIREKSMDL